MQLLSDQNVKARKRHTCDACLLKIEVGEVYNRATSKDGGYWYVWRQHLECQAEAARVHAKDREVELEAGWLRDEPASQSAEWQAWYVSRGGKL